MRTTRAQIDFALSETCPAPTYGRAGRVVLRGSKRKPHCGRHCRLRTIGDLPNSNLWFGKSCNIARQQVEPAQPAQIRRFFSLHLRLECYIMELDTNINGGTYYAGTETAHGLKHLEHFWQGH